MAGMKKVVVKVSIHGEKDRQKVMKAVSSLPGIESMAVDMKASKITVVGDVDPVDIVGKLKKQWSPQIDTVGPAKEEKQNVNKQEKTPTQSQVVEFKLWPEHYYRYNTQPYYHAYVDENPNSCVIS